MDDMAHARQYALFRRRISRRKRSPHRHLVKINCLLAHRKLNGALTRAATAGKEDATVTRPTVPAPTAAQAPVPIDFEPLIGSCEAARLLGNIHVKTLQRYARHARIPGYQIGGHWYFRASELDYWLRSQINFSCHPCRSK